MSKYCSKCNSEKPMEEFYTDRQKSDGKGSQCKDCVKLYKQSAAGIKARETYYRSAAGKATQQRFWRSDKGKAAMQKYRGDNPEKIKAHNALNAAVNRGKILRPDVCSFCGVTCIPDGHHADYTKPFEVEWLCKPCHRLAHNFYSKQRGQQCQTI